MVADNANPTGGASNPPPPASGKTIDTAALRAASAGVVGKHAEKRGPGRPRKDGSPARSVAQASPKTTADAPPVATPIDLDFIKKVSEQGISVLDSFVCKKIHRSVCLISPGLEKYAENVTSAVEMGDGEKEMVSAIIVALAQKYNAAFRFAPEISLVTWGIGYGVRIHTALKEIEEIAMRVERARAKSAADANSPQAN